MAKPRPRLNDEELAMLNEHRLRRIADKLTNATQPNAPAVKTAGPFGGV